jgi:hypothetical protein
MTQSSDNHFFVDRLSIVDEQIEQLFLQAKSRQTKRTLIETLRTIHHDLMERPLEVGDPAFRTKKEGGVVCHRIVRPLVVHFVVFENEKIVCILKVAAITPLE